MMPSASSTIVRVGLDLRESTCRLVEVEARAIQGLEPGDVRVRVCHGLPVQDSAAFSTELARLRRERGLAREAWVTIWGLRAVHRTLYLLPGMGVDARAFALRELAPDLDLLQEGDQPPAVAQVVGPDVAVGPHRRIEVSTVAVSSVDLTSRLQPVVDAGFHVVGVSTPAMALAAVARRKRDVPPHLAAAFVELGWRATCIAIVRDGVLLVGRELPWGQATELDGFPSRLLDELRRTMQFVRQAARAPVEAVTLCGDGDLRALAFPLSEGLGMPVQTLDSLTGIDAESLPAPAADFRATVASFRPAIATAAETVDPWSLPVPPGNARRWGVGASVAAGFLAALVGLSAWYGLLHIDPGPEPEDTTPAPRRVTASPDGAVPAPPGSPSADSGAGPGPVETGADVARAVARAPVVTVAAPPLEAVVSSILHSSSRRLAIVNGEIVREGDWIGPFRVFDIEPRRLVLVEPQGGRRVLELGGAPAEGVAR